MSDEEKNERRAQKRERIARAVHAVCDREMDDDDDAALVCDALGHILGSLLGTLSPELREPGFQIFRASVARSMKLHEAALVGGFIRQIPPTLGKVK